MTAAVAKLKLVYRKASELTPSPNNARTHSDEQIQQIVESIKEFGWTNPILLDGDNGILAGHGRLEAALELGIDKVPTIDISGLSDAQKRAYIIADNKLALNASWNNDLLQIELADLSELGFNLDLTGFNEEEIRLQFEELPSDNKDIDEDALDKKTHECPKCQFTW